MGSGSSGGSFGNTQGKRAELIEELKRNKVKFTEKDIVFITRDKTGQIVWLEKGNSSAGFEHILSRHANNFSDLGIPKSEIHSFLERVFTDGEIVSNSLRTVNGRVGYERIFYYNGRHYVLTGVGTNGFIVSAYHVTL